MWLQQLVWTALSLEHGMEQLITLLNSSIIAQELADN